MDLRLPAHDLPDDLLRELNALAALDGIPTVLYARISEDREGNILGERRQIKDTGPLFARYGLRLVGVYLDNDISAASGKRRPDFEAMLVRLTEDARALALWHPDRAYRRSPDLERLIAIVEQHRTAVHTAMAGEIDLTTATGRAMARTAAVWAGHYVEHGKEQMRLAKRQAAEMGKFLGGPRPFGYEKDGLTLRPVEAAMIKDAARRVLAGEKLYPIVAEWEASEVRPPASNSTRWRLNTTKRILLRPRNAGLSEVDGQTYPAQCEAILTTAEHFALKAILTDPARNTGGSRDRTRVGSGLYLCGMCDHAVTLMAGPRGLYRCREQMHLQRLAAPIDKHVVAVIGKVLARPETRLRMYDDAAVDVAAIETEAVSLQEQLDELARERGRREIDAREYRLMAEPMRADLTVLRQRLERAGERSPLAGIADADDVEEAWESAPLSRKRAVVGALAEVTVTHARHGRQPGGGYFDAASVVIVPR